MPYSPDAPDLALRLPTVPEAVIVPFRNIGS
jgi:hypothetical protein